MQNNDDEASSFLKVWGDYVNGYPLRSIRSITITKGAADEYRSLAKRIREHRGMHPLSISFSVPAEPLNLVWQSPINRHAASFMRIVKKREWTAAKSPFYLQTNGKLQWYF